MFRRAIVPVAGLAMIVMFLVLRRLSEGPHQAEEVTKSKSIGISTPPPLAAESSAPKSDGSQKPLTSVVKLPDSEHLPERPTPAASFALLLEHHRSARKKLARIPEGNTEGLSWSHAYGYIVARLLAICHPDEVEACALKVLAQPEVDENDALLAIKTLGTLASRGKKSAENALLEAARGKSWVTSKAALEALYAYDKEGVYRGLYLAQMSSGMMEIAQQGPYWQDEQTRQILQHLLDEGNKPGKPKVGGFMTEALTRLSTLEAPDRESQLEQLIAYRRDSPDWSVKLRLRQAWALRVVVMTPTPKAIKVLRERLDVAEAEANDVIQTDTEKVPRSIHPGYAHATGDDYYDQALLTYWRIGGELNKTEMQRLSYYGFLGDSKARLAELTGPEK